MSQELIEHIKFIAEAHSKFSTSPDKSVRRWDKKTPYFLHPLWCATMLSTETSLPESIRQKGLVALLYHDVLEDTTVALPSQLDQEILALIMGLTFEDFYQELRDIWKRPAEVRLLKLYDKVSNLLDSTWMSKRTKQLYIPYTKKLNHDVRHIFGELNITVIADAVINKVASSI